MNTTKKMKQRVTVENNVRVENKPILLSHSSTMWNKEKLLLKCYDLMSICDSSQISMLCIPRDYTDRTHL